MNSVLRLGNGMNSVLRGSHRWVFLGVLVLLGSEFAIAQPSMQRTVREAQQRVVKVYGAGGIASLEAYQSGFIVSPEGHIATAWSYVLDVDPIVVLDDGRRFESTVVGFEPTLELAVLKIEATDLPFFSLDDEFETQAGDPVLAVSNLFGIAAGNEPASVLRGTIAAVSNLDARRGTFQTVYSGPVYILDLIANNPGAAGGALVDSQARLIGMLGKELREASTGAWLNYALPVSELKSAIGDIVEGRPISTAGNEEQLLPRDLSHQPQTLGLVLVPDVLENTPAYVDAVIPNSPAEEAGVRADDLILLIEGARLKGQASFRKTLRTIDRRDPVSLTIQRGSEIIPLQLQPR